MPTPPIVFIMLVPDPVRDDGWSIHFSALNAPSGVGGEVTKWIPDLRCTASGMTAISIVMLDLIWYLFLERANGSDL